MINRLTWRPLGVFLFSCAFLAACGPPDTVEIGLRRESRTGPEPARAGASPAERFGGSDPARRGAPPEQTMAWDVPPGWEELAAGGMRIANLRPAGHPDAECSVIALSGSGGAVLDNVNRWRNQMGLAPVAEAELANLPHADALGRHGIRVELQGSYSGMENEAQEDWGLVGIILPDEASTIFVKMTGPTGLVATETPAFDVFCASLRLESARVAGTFGGGGGGGSMGFALPDGWRDVGAAGMRVVNLEAGEGSQCFVITLRGEAGGLLDNVNRWRGEFGEDPLDAAGVAALEQMSFLGEPSPLLELTGEYAGMGADTGGGMAMLGTMLIRSTESVFVKMVGPAEEMAGHRDGFVAFVESLKEGNQ